MLFNKNIIKEKIKLIDIFFKKHLKKKAKIAVTGLNPHCESIDIFNEDEKIIKPAIKILNNSANKNGVKPSSMIGLSQPISVPNHKIPKK